MFQTVPEPDSRQDPARRVECFLPIHATNQQRHGHIFQRRKLREQVMELIDKTEVPVSPISAANFSQRREILAHQGYVARRWRI